MSEACKFSSQVLPLRGRKGEYMSISQKDSEWLHFFLTPVARRASASSSSLPLVLLSWSSPAHEGISMSSMPRKTLLNAREAFAPRTIG